MCCLVCLSYFVPFVFVGGVDQKETRGLYNVIEMILQFNIAVAYLTIGYGLFQSALMALLSCLTRFGAL